MDIQEKADFIDKEIEKLMHICITDKGINIIEFTAILFNIGLGCTLNLFNNEEKFQQGLQLAVDKAIKEHREENSATTIKPIIPSKDDLLGLLKSLKEKYHVNE